MVTSHDIAAVLTLLAGLWMNPDITAMWQYTDTLFDTQRQMNLTTLLLQNITTFDG